jgi:hypothetical protein
MSKNEKLPAVAATKAVSAVAAGDDFAEFAGAGMENVTANDVIIPRLTILQQLSPQLNARKPEFITGAEQGDICDVATGDLFKGGVAFLPVHYRKDWIEWAPRASGKGLVAVHSTPDILNTCRRDDKNRPITPNGNLVQETAQWFGLNLTAGRRKCFLPMASTALKRSKKWMNLATGEILKRADGSEFVAPLFYRTYDLKTAPETNNEGEWHTWLISRGPALPELDNWQAIKEEAVKFRDALIAGTASADLSADDDHNAAGEGAM